MTPEQDALAHLIANDPELRETFAHLVQTVAAMVKAAEAVREFLPIYFEALAAVAEEDET